MKFARITVGMLGVGMARSRLDYRPGAGLQTADPSVLPQSERPVFTGNRFIVQSLQGNEANLDHQVGAGAHRRILENPGRG